MGDRPFERYFLSLLFIYMATSLYGVVWLSDEFDYERSLLYGFVSIPLTIGFFSLGSFVPNWQNRYRQAFHLSFAALLVAHLWGNLLLLNRVGGSDPRTVRMAVVGQPLNMAYKRGGFGWLYRQRW